MSEKINRKYYFGNACVHVVWLRFAAGGEHVQEGCTGGDDDGDDGPSIVHFGDVVAFVRN